jgi:phage shock protein PspC (stress-responsive transcriptional regulator)
MSNKQLTKSRNNKMVSGVIGGIGEYLGLSPDVVTIIRIVYAVLSVVSWFSLVIIYIIVASILPSAPRNATHYQQNFSQWPGDKKNEASKKRKDVTPFDDDDDWAQF